MKITRELLLNNGFEERQVEGHTIFVKGNRALFYLLNVWIPCFYAAGTPLADSIYITTMGQSEILEGL